MQAANFDAAVLNFIRSGVPGKFEGLEDVVPSLFSGPSPGQEEGEIVEVPLFSGAIIFTPSYRRDTIPPAGSQMADPIYLDKVNLIKRLLVNRIPGFSIANADQKINVATYQPIENMAQSQIEPWLGLLTFEYVPQHVSTVNSGCAVLRAIRIHVEDRILPVIEWNWPADPSVVGPLKSKNKRQAACPLLPQDTGAAPASFFDIGTPVGGVASPTSILEPSPTTPESTAPTSNLDLPAPVATSTELDPSPTAAVHPSCGTWLLNPNGVQVGTNCLGGVSEPVTVTVGSAKTAVETGY